MRLWKRAIELTVGTTLITELRVGFKVARSAIGEPNTAEVTVYNLREATRVSLQEEDVPVRIEAGYEESIGQIFFGTVRTTQHKRDGVDLVTTFTAGDGDAIRSGRINTSMAPGAEVGAAMAELAGSLGISADDAIQKLRDGDIRGGVTQFIHGITLSGNAYDELQRLLSASGLEASVQDGQLQVVERGQPTADQAVLLTSESGLIGPPEIGKNGIVKARSLLQPGIYPGRKVQIQSTHVDGSFRCDSVIHTGDTHGGDWYSEIEGRPL